MKQVVIVLAVDSFVLGKPLHLINSSYIQQLLFLIIHALVETSHILHDYEVALSDCHNYQDLQDRINDVLAESFISLPMLHFALTF